MKSRLSLMCLMAVSVAAGASVENGPDYGLGRVQPPPDVVAGMSPEASPANYDASRFSPSPDYAGKPYEVQAQQVIYGGKHRIDAPRPAIEYGYPLYQEGPLPSAHSLFGRKNLGRTQALVFGDLRTAVAYNDNGKPRSGQVATRLNLDLDLRFTATERVHMFSRPLDNAGKFTRYEFAGDNVGKGDFIRDFKPDTLFFEGDLGAITSGVRDKSQNWDGPFAVGLVPLLFQNGVWMEDAILGGAYTIPARNSPKFDISNADVTFFAGTDKVTSGAIRNKDGTIADHGARLYGTAAFLETLQGYSEFGYGYTEDKRGHGFGYHNLTAAFTRRYGGWLSNSVRAIGNVGQDPKGGAAKTADGYVVLIENSFITRLPLTLIPYANFFYGDKKPQALARDGLAGGVLRNTGINFETDGLTGFPKLDDSANDAWGGALGLQYLFNLDQQVVVEAATVQPHGGQALAKGDEYALGLRYQRPLSLAWIVRADGMLGSREGDDNLSGMRLEFRRKF